MLCLTHYVKGTILDVIVYIIEKCLLWLSRLSVNYDDGKLKARFVSFKGLAAIAKHWLNFYLLLITSKHIILIFFSGGFIIALFFSFICIDIVSFVYIFCLHLYSEF